MRFFNNSNIANIDKIELQYLRYILHVYSIMNNDQLLELDGESDTGNVSLYASKPGSKSGMWDYFGYKQDASGKLIEGQGTPKYPSTFKMLDLIQKVTLWSGGNRMKIRWQGSI